LTALHRATGKGELIYSLDCKAIEAEISDMKYKPKMPSPEFDQLNLATLIDH
jgi:hypothetical protein